MGASGKKEDVNTLPVGFMLQHQYRIEKVIGHGGFGITYLAYDIQGSRRVCVKELFPCKDVVRNTTGGGIRVVSGQEEYFDHLKKRFLEEAEALYRFHSLREVVNVYRYFETNNTAYFVMEYLTGTDLRHMILEKGKCSWDELSDYARQVLRALYAIHKEGLIHRDLSPDNIFITSTGRAVLIDFGSVRSYQNSQGFTTFLKECFAPFEQYQTKGNQGPWTDIYSFSVTLYAALTGLVPPRAPDRLTKAKPTLPVGVARPDLPQNVAEAITKGMEVLPTDRFRSAEEMYSALFPAESASWKKSDTGKNSGSNRGAQTGKNKDSKPGSYKNGKSKSGSKTVPPNSAGGGVRLYCDRGYFLGKVWTFPPVTGKTMGRSTQCGLVWPPNSKGISRRQCTVWTNQQGALFVRDDNSSYGTCVNGKRIPPQQWVRLRSGDRISFAGEIFRVL